MSQQDPDEFTAQVTFHDAADYFSDEEWKLLHRWQKELYRNVMKEIHQALVSLGPLIATTVFSLRGKEKEELWPVENQDCERKHRINNSPSDTMANPDVLSRINKEEHQHLSNPRVSEGRERNDCLSAEFQFFNTDICLRKDEEPVPIFIDHLGEEIAERSTNKNSGDDVVSFRIKDEGETYCMDTQDSTRLENISSPTGIGTMTKKGDSVKLTGKSTPGKASLGKAKLDTVHSFEKGTISESQRWPSANHKLEREDTTHCESGLSNATHLDFHQESPQVQRLETYNDLSSNLCHWNLLKCQPNRQENTSVYSCSECKESFSKKKDLIYHKSTHMVVRPYQCNECEKSFSKKDHLFVHKRTHTGERPYNCALCDKSFSQKGVLNRHQRTHMYAKT